MKTTDVFYTASRIRNIDGIPTTNDELEVRDAEGDQLCISPVISINDDIIQTQYGKFRIGGEKNLAGIQTFEHIEDDGCYSPVHAILVN